MKKLSLLLALAASLPLFADDNWCTDRNGHNNDMVRHFEVRQEHLAAAPEIVVNPAMNGSIRIHGGSTSDVVVKACVQTSALDGGSAEALAKQVSITDGPGRLVAKGPETNGQNWWSVSYDIWLPASSALDLHAHNGSIHVEDTTGGIRAETVNGSLSFRNVSGNVVGDTQNGSLTVLVSGAATASTGTLKLKTVNGSINLQLPSNFGAEVETSTVNGSLKNDFAAGDTNNRERSKQQHFTIGAGGARIDAETVNGSVHIARES